MAERTVSPGVALEYRVARLEFSDGALVRTQVPVLGPGDSGKRILTDIDVLSIDFDQRLRERRTIFECKSVRGQKGEPDRLLWLAGFRSLVHADRAVLVRDAVTLRGRDLARRLEVSTLDGVTLQRREADIAWLPQHFAAVGGDAQRAMQTKAEAQLKTVRSISPGLLQFLRWDVFFAEPHAILGALESLAGSLDHNILPPEGRRLVAGYAVQAVVLAGLRSGASLEWITPKELHTSLEMGLTTGSPHDDQVLDVLRFADDYFRVVLEDVHREYSASGAKRLATRPPSLRHEMMRHPKWLLRFVDFAERLRARGSIARELPQTVDLLAMDAIPGGSAWTAPAFDHLFTVDHRQLLAIASNMVIGIGLDALMPEMDEFLAVPFDRVPPVAPARRDAYREGSSSSPIRGR